LPKRGPQCKIGYHKPFNSLLKVLCTGRQWKELPLEKGPEGKAELHYPGVFKLFARWAKDGSLERAFLASLSTATVRTPWPKKGRCHWLQWPQTPEVRESARDYR